jgi:hypothetical protein
MLRVVPGSIPGETPSFAVLEEPGSIVLVWRWRGTRLEEFGSLCVCEAWILQAERRSTRPFFCLWYACQLAYCLCYGRSRGTCVKGLQEVCSGTSRLISCQRRKDMNSGKCLLCLFAHPSCNTKTKDKARKKTMSRPDKFRELSRCKEQLIEIALCL